MLKTWVVEGELPYRIKIANLEGAGDSPARAAMAALSAGGIIPAGTTDHYKAASIIFWNYGPATCPSWAKLVRILEKDTFEERLDEGGER